MERKNMVLLTVIAVATLLVAVVGATFAYFTATVTDNFTGSDNNGQADVSAAKIANTLTFATTDSNSGSFTATDVYPGHKEVAEIIVKAKSDSDEDAEAAVRFKYTVTSNTFGSDSLKISLYKSNSQITLTENQFNCVQQSELEDGTTYKLFEKCDETNTALSGATLVQGSDQNIQSTGTFEIARDVIENVGQSEKTVYYYVVVEFVNKGSGQNEADNAKELKGKIEVSAA